MNVGDALRINGGFGLAQQRVHFGVARQHDVEQRLLHRWDFLRHEPHARAAARTDGAVAAIRLLPDEAQQRRLARAVSAHKPDLPAFGDEGGGVLEQRASPDTVGEIVNFEHGLGFAAWR